MKYMLRLIAICCAIMLSIMMPVAADTAGARPNVMATGALREIYIDDELARAMFEIANEDRARAGLKAFELDARLCEAARTRAFEITQELSHTRPDGTKFATVCEGAYAENIARGQRSAARVMAAWMSSEGHRANMLNPRYSKIGVCACNVGGVVYWVQLFGR